MNLDIYTARETGTDAGLAVVAVASISGMAAQGILSVHLLVAMLTLSLTALINLDRIAANSTKLAGWVRSLRRGKRT